MPNISKQQLEDYQQLCHERHNGRLLTPDAIHFICQSYDYNAEAIGKHFLELLPTLMKEE